MYENNNYAIVVIAYNRLDSLKRVLKMLDKANYGKDSVTLIISIDKSDTNIVENYAFEFKWEHGNKYVKTHEENLGLKNHVLSIGEYLKEYEAITVLEDDIFVSPLYYQYMKQAVDFYKHDTRIAGISLYNHLWQIESDRPFVPAKNRYDNYFLQYAQSWGQIWLKDSWNEFTTWLENNNVELKDMNGIPENVKKWPESSWLKYHIAYCIQNDKYFVYPYTSLSTNFTEVGQHNTSKLTKYQVPMNYDEYQEFRFSELDEENAVIYDAYFERKGISNNLNIKEEDLTIDLYGQKKEINTKYLISMENLNYRIIDSYGLELRPHEMNIMFGLEGKIIKFYDTSIVQNNTDSDIDFIKWSYDNKNKKVKPMMKYIIKKIINKIKFI